MLRDRSPHGSTDRFPSPSEPNFLTAAYPRTAPLNDLRNPHDSPSLVSQVRGPQKMPLLSARCAHRQPLLQHPSLRPALLLPPVFHPRPVECGYRIQTPPVDASSCSSFPSVPRLAVEPCVRLTSRSATGLEFPPHDPNVGASGKAP